MKSFVSACLLLMFLFPLMVSGQNCQIKIEGNVKDPSCKGGMDAAISLRISGGTPPYTYRWHSGHEGPAINELTAGTYRVTVQDSDGCHSKAVFTLKAAEKELGLKVEQQQTAKGKVLQVVFKGNTKPAAIYIKDMSKGFSAPQTAYNGEVLNSGTYLLEAFTAEGCSVLQQLIIEAN